MKSPISPGVYSVQIKNSSHGWEYSYWDGFRWSVPMDSFSRAYSVREIPTTQTIKEWKEPFFPDPFDE